MPPKGTKMRLYGRPPVPVHFWPGLELVAGGRFPCGIAARSPALHTNAPGEVRCRRCVRSRYVQDALRRGVTVMVRSADVLEAEGLVRRSR